MEIVRLNRKAGWSACLARWHGREWGHLYEDWDATVALRDFLTEPDEGLPGTFVAVEGEELVGSVSVVTGDLPGAPDEWNPWVASLFVRSEWRGRGWGCRLIERAVAVAAECGAAEAWCLTEERQSLFARCEFEWVAESTANGWAVSVMRRVIDPGRVRVADASAGLTTRSW
ncbi:MAG: GNAT family N-acetyltransferase [Chthoniobacterales bacterium]